VPWRSPGAASSKTGIDTGWNLSKHMQDHILPHPLEVTSFAGLVVLEEVLQN